MRRPTALILTASYGSGHLQAANVIAAELRRKGIEPIISDVFSESYPTLSNLTQSLFIKSFSRGASFYKWFYYGTNKLNSKGLAKFSRYLGRKRLKEMVIEHRPNFIITTFPLHSASFFIKKSGFPIPIYTVITDYCMHPYWMNPLIDHYFVASNLIKSELLNEKIQAERITVSGIPIRPEFELSINKEAVYPKYNLSPNKHTIIISAGAYGVLKNVKELCQSLLNLPNCQIIAIAGKNESLYERLLPLALTYPQTFRLFGYVEEIHELMAISDCFITKPGGITVTEAAALNVPLILYQPIPGQETENAIFFEEQGAALISYSLSETISHVQKLLASEELVCGMKESLKRIHHSHSATIITNHAMRQMEQEASLLR